MLALRVTYVGELGWVLPRPSPAAAPGVCDIWAGDTPVEAGLAWAVKMKSGVEFIGRDAIAAQLAAGVTNRLATFTADPCILLLGRETIYRNGERVGWLSSGGYGHSVGKSIGLGYVRSPAGVTDEFVPSGTYELEVASERAAAQVTLSPLYEPQNARVRA